MEPDSSELRALTSADPKATPSRWTLRKDSYPATEIQVTVDEPACATASSPHAKPLSGLGEVQVIPVDELNITQVASTRFCKSPVLQPTIPPKSPQLLPKLLHSRDKSPKLRHKPPSDEHAGRTRRTDTFSDQDSSDDDDDDDDQGHAVAGTATLEEHMLIRALEKDFATLVILQLTSTNQSFIRTDMNRFDLLAACRNAVPQLPRGAAAAADCDFLGAPVQLRDIRCLQGVSEPALLVRRGAIIVSIDPINAIITHDTAYMVLPDGADELLAPLLRRFRDAHDNGAAAGGGAGGAGGGGGGGMPFEFVALEALLITLVNSLMQDVSHCLGTKTRLLDQLRRRMSSRLLTKVLRLKRRIDEVLGAVAAAGAALEEVQHDDDLMALMYLSAARAAPAAYGAAVRGRRCDVLQAEVLLDAYALEFGGLARGLGLALREIDDTEDLLRFRLDRARNQLIKVDVLFGAGSMFLTLLTVVGGYFGMNLPFGAYTDGSVPPGGEFQPPTGGAVYDPAWPDGPSRGFVAVAAGSSAAVVVLLVVTLLCLRRAGALRS